MFDKETYWKRRNAKPEIRRAGLRLEKARLIVAVHSSPDWPKKEPGKKSREAAARRQARSESMPSLFVTERRSKKPRTTCFYCTNPIDQDGFCANHHAFVFKGMNNHQRMLEKAALRQMRADERKAKREAAEGVPA